MYGCMYVCMYVGVCMCVRVCVCMYVCLFLFVCLRVGVCGSVRVQIKKIGAVTWFFIFILFNQTMDDSSNGIAFGYLKKTKLMK